MLGNKKHKRGSGHRRQPSATTGGFVSVDLRSLLGQRRKIIACEIGCTCIGRLGKRNVSYVFPIVHLPQWLKVMVQWVRQDV